MAKPAKSKTKPRKADPVVTEIIRNGVIAVTEEMKTNLMRTAYNMIIYEALDFTVGLFTPEGETVSIGLGLPTFIRGMAETVKAKLRHFGVKNIEPGDIFVTNDAYTTGSHLNHFTFTLPIFHRGKLVGFVVLHGALARRRRRARRHDHGHLFRRPPDPDREVPGPRQVNQDLVDIIRMNVRLPPRAMGDLRAQVTAVKTGERLLPRTARALRPRRSDARDPRHHGPLRGGGAARAPRRSPTASTRPSPAWTTTASTSASASRSA